MNLIPDYSSKKLAKQLIQQLNLMREALKTTQKQVIMLNVWMKFNPPFYDIVLP